MPIVQIHLLEGRDVEKKRNIVKKVTEAICETANVPPEQVRVILSEMAFENYSVAGVLKADQKK